jgi:hypothetical protein
LPGFWCLDVPVHHTHSIWVQGFWPLFQVESELSEHDIDIVFQNFGKPGPLAVVMNPFEVIGTKFMSPLKILHIIIQKLSLKNDITTLVLKDILLNLWHKYIFIGFLSALAFLFQLIGISIILGLFRNNIKLPFDLHDKLLNGFSDHYLIIFSFVILSISAMLMFVARKITVDMMIDYESLCANKIFSIISTSLKDNFNDSEIIRLLSKDCRFGGRIVQEMSNIVMPLGISIIAFPVLFYISFQATLAIVVIMIVSLFPYGLIASRANFVSSSFEKSAGTDSQYKKQVIKDFRKNEHNQEPLNFPHYEFKKYYRQRLIMPHYGILIGGIQLALCLAVLGWWGASVEKNSTNVSSVVLYGVIAIFMLNHFITLAKVFANFHVFLAYFQRAFIVIKGIDYAQIKSSPNNGDNVISMTEEEF